MQFNNLDAAINFYEISKNKSIVASPLDLHADGDE